MKKVLVIGNGPSAKELDFLNVSIHTVGMNAAYRYWDTIDFRPTYYACLDDVVVISHQDRIKTLIDEGRIKKFFLHYNILIKFPELANNPNVLIFEPDFNKKDPQGIFYNNLCTTGSFSIRWMLSLGYSVIGLIGIDCNYVEVVQNARRVDDVKLEITEDSQNNPNYFFQGYQLKGDRYNIPNKPSVKVDHSVHADSVHRVLKDCQRLNIDAQIINTSLNNLDLENLMPIESFLSTSFDGKFRNLFNDVENRFTVLTTLYENISEDRINEFYLCFKKNYLNPFVYQVHIFFETDKSNDEALRYIKDNYLKVFELFKKKKFKLIITKKRFTYQDYFEYANSELDKRNIIIANTDIYFNDTLQHIYKYNLDNKLFLLTRWSLNDDDNLYLPVVGELKYPWSKINYNHLLPISIFRKNLNPHFDKDYCGDMDWVINDPNNDLIIYNEKCKIRIKSDKSKPFKTYGRLTYNKLLNAGCKFRNEFSQDAWIFKTPFTHYKYFKCDFQLGTFKCDSLLNFSVLQYSAVTPEFKLANPCLTVQSVHIDKLTSKREVDYDEYRKSLDEELLKLCGQAFIPWTYLGELDNN